MSLTAGTRGPVTIELEDPFGNPSGATAPESISLASTSAAGSFFASQTTTSAVTSVNLAAGQSTISFYYSDTTAGTPALTASVAGIGSAPPVQQETVSPAAATQLVFANAALTIAAGTIGTLVIELEDPFGNLASSTSPQTINLSTTSTGGVFSITSVGTIDVTTRVLSLTAGQTSADVDYEDTAAGIWTITAGDPALDSSPTQQATVTPAPASRLVITSPPLVLAAGSIGPVTIELEDQFGNPGATAATAQTISLATTSADGTYFGSSTGGTPVEHIDIAAGQSSLTFSYADTRAGTPTLTFSAAAPRLRGHAASPHRTGAGHPACCHDPAAGRRHRRGGLLPGRGCGR